MRRLNKTNYMLYPAHGRYSINGGYYYKTKEEEITVNVRNRGNSESTHCHYL